MKWIKFMQLGLISLASACSVELQRGLDEAQANDVLLALAQAGIRAAKAPTRGAPDQFTVNTRHDQVGRALAVLRREDLPRPTARGFAEVFRSPSLVPTAVEEQARLIEAVTGEVSTTLQDVDGIHRARVHFVPAQGQRAARASILLSTWRGDRPISADEVRKIALGAIADLKPEHIDVVFTERSREASLPGIVSSEPALPILAVLVALLGLALLVSSLRTLSIRRRLQEMLHSGSFPERT